MNRFNLNVFFVLLLFLTGCGLIIISPRGKHEKYADYKVDLNTKPSELIKMYLPEVDIENKNFCIISYDAYCQFCGRIQLINNLWEKSRDNYNWMAITIYDSLECSNWDAKIKKDLDSCTYKFDNYFEVHGLRASLVNLYVENNFNDVDYVTVALIIKNDSIVYFSNGGVHSYEVYKEMLSILEDTDD